MEQDLRDVRELANVKVPAASSTAARRLSADQRREVAPARWARLISSIPPPSAWPPSARASPSPPPPRSPGPSNPCTEFSHDPSSNHARRVVPKWETPPCPSESSSTTAPAEQSDLRRRSAARFAATYPDEFPIVGPATSGLAEPSIATASPTASGAEPTVWSSCPSSSAPASAGTRTSPACSKRATTPRGRDHHRPAPRHRRPPSCRLIAQRIEKRLLPPPRAAAAKPPSHTEPPPTTATTT